jgi:hypothetical protein
LLLGVPMAAIVVRRPQDRVLFAAVGAVGPDISWAVLAQQLKKHLGVVNFGGGDLVVTDSFVGVVDGDGVFVAVVLPAVLFGLAGVHVFLPLDVRIRFETFGSIASFDLALFTAVALDRGADQASVDDLAFPGFETFAFQLPFEVVEQRFDEAFFGEPFSE